MRTLARRFARLTACSSMLDTECCCSAVPARPGRKVRELVHCAGPRLVASTVPTRCEHRSQGVLACFGEAVALRCGAFWSGPEHRVEGRHRPFPASTSCDGPPREEEGWVSVVRFAVGMCLLALTCLAATCDYRPAPPTLLNESGEPLEAHLFRVRDGVLEPAPISPEEFIDQLQLAPREGCANYDVLELRRPGGEQVLVRHDFRQQPFCESDVWAYRGGDELVIDR